MENNTTEFKEVAAKKPRAKAPKKVVDAATIPETVKEEVVTEAKKTMVPKDIDTSQYITVKNGFQGKLIYRSKRTGESFIWDNFGDEQEIELRELKNAKNSAKGFFVNNWFMFDEDWVVDYLGVRNFYKHAVKIEDFDEIFTKSPAEIKTIVTAMSKGQQRSVAYRAKQLIAEKEIDSLKAISALEEALGFELIER